MSRTITAALLAAAALALSPAGALAAGGNYTITGGTPAEQAQVRQALNASTFNWNLLQPVQVTIQPGAGDYSTPGQIFLDPALLDSGRFAWAIVQHEFAHQIDFQLLNEQSRARLAAALGGTQWWPAATGDHSSFTCERFASMIAWAYWQSNDNSLKPRSSTDEAGAMPVAAFRTLLASALGQPSAAVATPDPQTVYAPAPVKKPATTKPAVRRSSAA